MLFDYINASTGLSAQLIPASIYLAVLSEIEAQLPELLLRSDWRSVDVDYETPRVERVWLQYGSLRINLHRLHADRISKTFFHKHPWPSAMKVLEGSYEMGIGFGSVETDPPLAATLILAQGSSYEMVHLDSWHYVSPISELSYTLMVSGPPWPGREKPSSLTLKELSVEAKDQILNFFRKKYSSSL